MPVSGTITIWNTVSSFIAPPSFSGVPMISSIALSSICPLAASHSAIRLLRRVSPSQDAASEGVGKSQSGLTK